MRTLVPYRSRPAAARTRARGTGGHVDKTIELVPMTGALGAEVRGIDPAPADATAAAAIRAALLEYLVLVFRDVDITPQQQIAFARLFGEVHPPPLRTRFSEMPEMNVLDQTSGKGDADQWHNDNTYT